MRLIDADALKAKAMTHYDWNDYIDVEDIDDAPTIEERKTGKWIVKQRGHATDVCCSVCKEIRFKDYSWGYTAEEIQAEVDDDEQMPKFCENCGAKMEIDE